MPQIKYYVVEQTREVKVTANSSEDAARIAAAAFEHGQDSAGRVARDKGPEGVWGNTTSKIEDTSLSVRKDY